MNKPDNMQLPLPFTPEQFRDMLKLRDIMMPQIEDNLKRTKASGVDTSQLEQQYKASKDQLLKTIDAWKDKYS